MTYILYAQKLYKGSDAIRNPHKIVMFYRTAAPIVLSVVVKLILADCPWEM